MCTECEKEGRLHDYDEFISFFTLQEMKKISGRSKSREKRPVIHDAAGKWVRCCNCNRALFPLRRNCSNCSFYDQLLGIWKNQESMLESNFVEYQANKREEERLARDHCLPCAIRQMQFSPHSRSKLLSDFV